jgi:transcriptional regulator with XRE-family HTH domain/tetratricopeptide (TPR) repeat protein
METDEGARDLGLTILLLCEIVGWSLRELSRRTGIDKGSINSYVSGTVTPTAKNRKRIADAFGVDPLLFDQLTPLCRAFRVAYDGAVESGVREAGDTEKAFVEQVGGVARTAMKPLLQELEAVAASPRAEDQPWAEALWARMELLPVNERSRSQSLIVGVLLGDQRSWALAERICLASEASAANRADEALRLARLAVRLAEHVPEEDFRLLVIGWVEPFLANAQRVGGDLAAAAQTLAHADGLWEEGAAGASAGLLDAVRRLDLKASLLIYFGKFEEVHALIAEALRGARAPRERGRLLLQKARTLEAAGEYEAALAVLAVAKPHLDAQDDPRLLLSYHFKRANYHCHLDLHEEAEALLPPVEASIDPGNELDGVRLDWLRGRIWAGLGRREEAVATLGRVRAYFHAERIAYDYAVVSVELGTLLLEEGRAREVRELAEEMMWIFKSQGIHKEALEALALFCHAAKAEQAGLDWARRLVKYLYRAQSNPGLKFER